MKTKMMIMMAALFLMGSEVAMARDNCVNVPRVREFVVESDSTVLVRSARSIYQRVEVSPQCARLDSEQILFEVGRQVWRVETGNGPVIVNQQGINNRVCDQTPHAAVVFVDRRRDAYRCRIERIERASAEDFEQAGAAVDVRR